MEEYRVLEEFPDYEVSTLGNIRNLHTQYELKHRKCKRDKYVRIMLYRNEVPFTKTIHRLVAQTFIDNPHNYEYIDHIDRNPSNNSVNNLRWVTKCMNNSNTHKKPTNTSGFKNVYWDSQKAKWCCKFNYNKKQIHVGFYDDDELPYGIALMDAMLIDYFGEYAVLNGEH